MGDAKLVFRFVSKYLGDDGMLTIRLCGLGPGTNFPLELRQHENGRFSNSVYLTIFVISFNASIFVHETAYRTFYLRRVGQSDIMSGVEA